MQAKRLQSDGSNDRSDRSERKRKSRFGDEEDNVIPEKTLIPMVRLLKVDIR